VRSHIAVADIKEQTATNDRAKHQEGHGVIVPPIANGTILACRVSDRHPPHRTTHDRRRR
jgi:hypothetical protein